LSGSLDVINNSANFIHYRVNDYDVGDQVRPHVSGASELTTSKTIACFADQNRSDTYFKFSDGTARYKWVSTQEASDESQVRKVSPEVLLINDNTFFVKNHTNKTTRLTIITMAGRVILDGTGRA
jgi:hypothetical protein